MIEWKGTQMAKGRVNDDRGGGRQWKEDLKRIPNLMVGGGWLSKSTAQRPHIGGVGAAFWAKEYAKRELRLPAEKTIDEDCLVVVGDKEVPLLEE